MRKFLYLISPNKIKPSFYVDLEEVLSSNKVMFFQLRLKDYSASKILNIDTDAKFRFERGIDPQSIELGLSKAAELISEICGGKISNFDIQKNGKFEKNKINSQT